MSSQDALFLHAHDGSATKQLDLVISVSLLSLTKFRNTLMTQNFLQMCKR